MNDLIVVNVLHSVYHLSDIVGCLLFGNPPPPRQYIIKLSASAELLQDIHILQIAEEPIHTHNVRMVHEHVDLQLLDELL